MNPLSTEITELYNLGYTPEEANKERQRRYYIGRVLSGYEEQYKNFIQLGYTHKEAYNEIISIRKAAARDERIRIAEEQGLPAPKFRRTKAEIEAGIPKKVVARVYHQYRTKRLDSTIYYCIRNGRWEEARTIDIINYMRDTDE